MCDLSCLDNHVDLATADNGVFNPHYSFKKWERGTEVIYLQSSVWSICNPRSLRSPKRCSFLKLPNLPTITINKFLPLDFTCTEKVYLDMQPLIRSVLDGCNVCIFAYGQTGAGKIYTMVRDVTHCLNDTSTTNLSQSDLGPLYFLYRVA